MKTIHIILLLGFLLYATEPQQFTIERFGRKIEANGFLMEWQKENANQYTGNNSFLWDAINTAKGVAGYFTFRSDDSCFTKKVRIYNKKQFSNQYMEIVIDNNFTEQDFYAFDKHADGKSITAEWLIPWDSISFDTSGQYKIGIAVYNSCIDSADSLLFSGEYFTKGNEPFKISKIAVQVAIILILMILFLRLRVKAKKLYKQSGK